MNARLSDDIIIVIQLILHFVLTIGIDGHTEVSFKSKKKKVLLSTIDGHTLARHVNLLFLIVANLYQFYLQFFFHL